MQLIHNLKLINISSCLKRKLHLHPAVTPPPSLPHRPWQPLILQLSSLYEFINGCFSQFALSHTGWWTLSPPFGNTVSEFLFEHPFSVAFIYTSENCRVILGILGFTLLRTLLIVFLTVAAPFHTPISHVPVSPHCQQIYLFFIFLNLIPVFSSGPFHCGLICISPWLMMFNIFCVPGAYFCIFLAVYFSLFSTSPKLYTVSFTFATMNTGKEHLS